MKNTFKEKLYKLLKSDKRLWDKEKKELNETLLKDLVDKLDVKLIELLLSNKKTIERFFIKIKDVYVFKTNDFKFFIDENKLDNSYTQYKNKIGLRVGNKLLSDRDEVVLDWPFKDCVLEGGQSTEEGLDTYFEYEEEKVKTVNGKKVKEIAGYKEKQSKRKEIFFNEILAQDEIDRLEDPKALVNWKRFTKDGEQEVKEIKRDSEINKKRGLPDDTITENLIIKGNNLLALHSLKKQFARKIKLIYVDPPYYFKEDKPNDTFAYNSNFKLSTWLTFMKNRLEVARNLLRDDGVIFVQIKDDGMAHLKLLMDDVFQDGFVNCITVKMSEASGVKMAHAKKRFPNIKEYLLFYKKSKSFDGFSKIDKYESKEWDKENNIFLKNFTKKQRQKLIKIEEKEKITQDDVKKSIAILSKVKKVPLCEKVKELSGNLDQKEWLFENSFRIIKTAGSSSLAKQVSEVEKVPNQDISAFTSRDGILFYYITDFNRETKTPRLQVLFADSAIWKNPCDFWQDIKTTGAIANERGVQLSGGKKPEKLLYRIISMTTKERDIVLDYHSGSGTTAGVAHKMKRQWITIEQIDNQIELTKIGLNNVINGDKTGISELVNWSGGGDFISIELAKWNKKAKNDILSCRNLEELEKIFNTLYEKYFLNYNFKIKEFIEGIPKKGIKPIIKEESFRGLSIEEQKKIFLAMLDLNQMYVQKTEMADKRFGISKPDQKWTSEFYNNGD